MRSDRQPLGFHGAFPSGIKRSGHLHRLDVLLRQFPVVAMLGARHVGKTTLTRRLAARRVSESTIFDLERTEELALLTDPMLALKPLRGPVVIDEADQSSATIRRASRSPAARSTQK